METYPGKAPIVTFNGDNYLSPRAQYSSLDEWEKSWKHLLRNFPQKSVCFANALLGKSNDQNVTNPQGTDESET